MRHVFNTTEPLLTQLSSNGYAFDQKLSRALELSASQVSIEPEDCGFPDSYLFLALYRLNTVLTRIVNLDESQFNLFQEYRLAERCAPEAVVPGRKLCTLLDTIVASLEADRTIGVRHFLRAVVNSAIDQPEEELGWLGFPGIVIHETFSTEVLLKGLRYSPWTSLDEATDVRSIYRNLVGLKEGTEDYQYMLSLEEGRIVFRTVSILDTLLTEGISGRRSPTQALLSHFGDKYTAFTVDEVLELEDLLNNANVRERELQSFFEQHPKFLRLWLHREIIPQPYLTREEDGPLIPDFILLDQTIQRHLILDLKLPCAKLVRMNRNRERFSSAVQAAKAQLLEYRDWFESKHNRDSFKRKYGLEVYRPRIGVVIGSSSEFRDDYQRQRLADRESPLEVFTYDDIVRLATERLALLRE